MIRQLRVCFMITVLALGLAAWPSMRPATLKSTVAPISVDEALANMPADSTQEGDALYATLIPSAPGCVVDLCGRLVPPGTGDDTAARFAIESLARYVMRDGAEGERKAYVQGIITALGAADDGDVKAFMIRKLELAGKNDAVPTLAGYLDDDRLCEPATQALLRIGTSRASSALHKALALSQGKRRVTLIQAMGVMKNRAAVATLVSFAQGNDPAVCQAALDALANIGDPDSEYLLAEAINDGDPFRKSHAQANYLRYARSLADRGHKKQALSVIHQTLRASATATESNVRGSALEAMAAIDPHKALDEMIGAMDSPYKDYRMAALDLAQQMPGRRITRRWIEVLESAAPVHQAEIIGMLGRRGDLVALPSIMRSIESEQPAVRLAAIEAAPRLAGAKAIPALVTRLEMSDKKETEAVKDQLARLPGDEAMVQLAAALPNQTAPARIALLEVLASRHAHGQSGIVLAQTAANEPEVATAAIKAMADVANPGDLPPLIDLLFTPNGNQNAKDVRKAIVAAAEAIPNPRTRTSVIIKRLAQADPAQKLALMPALSGLGGAEALQVVVDDTHSKDEALADTALRTLADWPDIDGAAPLLDVVKGEATLTHKVLALRGYVRLVKTDQIAADRKVPMLTAALAAAERPEDKKLIMGALGEIRTPEAFDVIVPLMEQPDIQAEAAQTAIQSACPRDGNDPGLRGLPVATALRRACDLTGNDDLRKRAEGHIASILAEEGYEPLFNGLDLTGWKGLMAPPNDNPIERAKLSPTAYAKAQAIADAMMREHWHVQDGIIVFDGKGLSLATARDYGDFEMLVDWKILPKGDSGIYLRGAPQVQIWDTNDNPEGSGGLYNNQKNPSKPLVCADRPVGQWNTFHIKMVGDRVTVHLNGKLVVDNVVMENYWDRNQPIFPTGQIELQNHGNNLYFRNIYLKEIPRKGLSYPLFNGRDLAGWEQVGGAPGNWSVENGILYTTGQGGGWLSTVKTYDNFDLSLDFRVVPDGNSGVFLRTPREGDPAYVGMEIQVLDDYAEMYAKIAPFQFTGSIYGLSAPAKRVTKPAGEWQTMRIRCQGRHVDIWLNGEQIQNANLDDYTSQADKHPGILRKGGYIGLQDHTDRVEYRNIMIEELAP